VPKVSPEDFDQLLQGRGHLQVVSHVPGRIRLKFDFSILSAAPQLAERGKEIIGAIRGIHDVDANIFARSLTIHYDPEALPPEWWDKLYGTDDAAAREVVEKLKSAYA
jgi:hypothetical protein